MSSLAKLRNVHPAWAFLALIPTFTLAGLGIAFKDDDALFLLFMGSSCLWSTVCLIGLWRATR